MSDQIAAEDFVKMTPSGNAICDITLVHNPMQIFLCGKNPVLLVNSHAGENSNWANWS